MLYGKSLRITSGVKAELGVGSIVNLQSNDGSKIWNLPQYLHIVWNGPFQVRPSSPPRCLHNPLVSLCCELGGRRLAGRATLPPRGSRTRVPGAIGRLYVPSWPLRTNQSFGR